MELFVKKCFCTFCTYSIYDHFRPVCGTKLCVCTWWQSYILELFGNFRQQNKLKRQYLTYHLKKFLGPMCQLTVDYLHTQTQSNISILLEPCLSLTAPMFTLPLVLVWSLPTIEEKYVGLLTTKCSTVFTSESQTVCLLFVNEHVVHSDFLEPFLWKQLLLQTRLILWDAKPKQWVKTC